MLKRITTWILVLTMVLTAGGLDVTAATATDCSKSTEADSIAAVSAAADAVDTDASISSSNTTASIASAVSTASTSATASTTASTTLSTEEYIEQQLEAAFLAHSSSCSFDASYKLTKDTIWSVFSEMINTDYRFFYVASTLRYSFSNGVVVTVTMTYTYSKTEADSMLDELENTIDQIVGNMDSSWSDMEKALYLHDYLTRNCEYDSATASSGTGVYNVNSYNAYGALVDGLAVCEGYAEAYLALAREAGLSCELISSSALGHEWNLVKISGKWYHVDVTWDDPLSDKVGRSRHQYFMKSTDYYKTSEGGHATSDWSITGSVSASSASNTAYDSYFWNDVDNGFEYVDSTWYGLVDGVIVSYTCNGTSFTMKSNVFTINDKWNVWGSTTSTYSSCHAGFSSYNGLLYYSTQSVVYSYNPSNGNSTSVYTLSDTYAAEGYIYGMSIDMYGSLKILLATSVSTSDWVGAYTVKRLNTLLSASSASTVSLDKCKISSLTNTTAGIKITWGKVTDATGYYIYRKTGSGSYGLVKTVTSGSTTSYTDTAVKSKSGTSYTYYVIAYYKSSSGTITKGTYSNTKALRRLSSATISSLTNASGGITVAWGKITGATGYYIYRKAGSGSYSLVKTITSGSTVSYTDSAVKSKNGTTYTYYVIPYYKNSSENITKGSYTNTKKTVRLTAVTLSSVKNSSSGKMTVKWTKNSKATGYQIQYSTSSSFASVDKTIRVSDASTISKTLSGLTKGKTYYVRVRAYKTVSGTRYYSAWSSKKSVKISK